MIQMESLVQVADNTGARSAKMIGVIGKRHPSGPHWRYYYLPHPRIHSHRFCEEGYCGEGRGGAHRRPDPP